MDMQITLHGLWEGGQNYFARELRCYDGKIKPLKVSEEQLCFKQIKLITSTLAEH